MISYLKKINDMNILCYLATPHIWARDLLTFGVQLICSCEINFVIC